MDKIRTYCAAGTVNPDGGGVVDADGSVHCDANPFGGTGWAFAPDGIRYSQVDYDRTREGIALAGQYESPTGNVRASVQFIQSRSEERRVGKECVSTGRSGWATYH